MSWSLSIYGHNAPSADVEATAREAYKALADKAGATGGSISGQGNDGVPISISFPEAKAQPEAETGAET